MNEYILECRYLTKVYQQTPVFHNLSFALRRGRIVGLLGPNGSGKTTLIKLAAGLLKPTMGDLLVDGMPIGPETKAIVSYLPDRNALPPKDTVSELCQLYETMFSDFDVQRALMLLNDLGIDLSAKLSQLSKGNKEKVQLILTMSRRAKLYLLDEPIAGVDPATRDYILETILGNYAEDATILISTHLIADVEKVLDDFIFLKNGVITRYGDAKEFCENEGITLDEAFRRDFKC